MSEIPADAADTPVPDDASDEVIVERVLPDDSLIRSLVEPFELVQAAVVPVAGGRTQDVLLVDAATYVDVVAHAKSSGFDVFVDLCGVDYFRRVPRFEVVVNLLSYTESRRIRIRVGVDGVNATIPSITDLFPGANFYERETYDLFGIVFEGHPDLTRILLPDDWEGHPLRKDYAVGSVPVQFKGSHKAL